MTSLGSLSVDLQALQHKVADLSASIDQLLKAQVALEDRQLDELDRIRAAVAVATDDLAGRMTALEVRSASRT